MSENLREQLAFLPAYLQGHLLLTLAAMAVSICVSVPLGVLITRVKSLRHAVLTFVNIVQTIPSLAILALAVALLGGQIGFLPAFIALTLYSMLPIVRNTVAGLDGIPPDVQEAALGIGMTPGQILLKVRLPLAMPVILAGIRTATVWTTGLATLSTLVGATSLGNYIFTGIQTRNLTAVTLGSLASAALALLLDGLLALVERTLTPQVGTDPAASGAKLRRWVLGGAVAGGVVLAVFSWTSARRPDFVVGAKGFTEQYIFAGLAASLLEDAGFTVDQRIGLGSDVPFTAAVAGEVSCYLEYSGTVWANRMGQQLNPGREEVLAQVLEWTDEQDGIVPLGPSGFENLYALAMRRDRAAELGVQSIADLAPLAPNLVCGGDLEFFGRSEWHQLRDAYDIDFREKLTFDAALMYDAVHQGQVDLITAYTTDGRVAAYDLLLLDDPREALLPYDGIVMASAEAADNPQFEAALAPLIDGLTTEQMREANKIVDVDGASIGEAVAFLRGKLGVE